MAKPITDDARIAMDIVEHSPSIALRVDGENGAWKTIFISRNIAKFGYDRDRFLCGELTWADVVHPDDIDMLVHTLDDFEARGVDVYTTTYRILTADGKSVWIRDNSTVTRDEKGRVLYSDCIISDHTEIVEKQDKIEDNLLQQRVLNDILQALHAAELDEAFQIILDRTGEYLNISRAILFEDNAEHTQCTAVYEWDNAGIACMMEKGDFVLDYARDIPDIEGDLVERGMRVVNYGQVPPGSTEEFGNEGVIAAAIFTVYQAGERYGFICFDECVLHRQWEDDTLVFLKNISKLVSTALVRKTSEEAILHMAYHNPLTGLVNRHRFDEYIGRAIESARAAGNEGFVLFIDMDDFKIINDGYGHAYGDALLVEVARWLREEFGQRARLFHFGGDEYVLLLENSTSRQARSVADAVLMRARHPWQVMDREFYCTVSIGTVRFPDGTDGAAEVTKKADIAISQAKRLGKNNSVFYNRSLDDNSLQRAETENRMRIAIENGFEGFTVYYQPIVDIAGQVMGAEALVRWMGEDGALISPGEFIPLAEYLGLIIPLGEFVLRRAAQKCRALNERYPKFTMSVNVSIRQFQQHDFAQRVEAIVQETGVDPGNLVLEVTEGMAAQDVQRMSDVIDELRAMGVSIAMDDFGTGYSSLNNMRELPLDVIKIDRSFIRDVANDAYSKSFVRLICDLCHTMGRLVCVEGVETVQQYRYCAACHADRIQGFYFHKPMPEDELNELMPVAFATAPKGT